MSQAAVPSIPVVKEAGKAKATSGRTDSTRKRIIIHALLILTAAIAAFPIIRVFGVALRPGNRLLDSEGQPISVPPGSIPEILENGDVVADGAPVARVGLFRIEGPLGRSGPSLLIPGAETRVLPLAEGHLRVGELEMGNSSPLEATIQMISAQRHFDTAMQAITTYRKLDEKAIEVGKIR